MTDIMFYHHVTIVELVQFISVVLSVFARVRLKQDRGMAELTRGKTETTRGMERSKTRHRGMEDRTSWGRKTSPAEKGRQSRRKTESQGGTREDRNLTIGSSPNLA